MIQANNISAIQSAKIIEYLESIGRPKSLIDSLKGKRLNKENLIYYINQNTKLRAEQWQKVFNILNKE